MVPGAAPPAAAGAADGSGGGSGGGASAGMGTGTGTGTGTSIPKDLPPGVQNFLKGAQEKIGFAAAVTGEKVKDMRLGEKVKDIPVNLPDKEEIAKIKTKSWAALKTGFANFEVGGLSRTAIFTRQNSKFRRRYLFQAVVSVVEFRVSIQI